MRVRESSKEDQKMIQLKCPECGTRLAFTSEPKPEPTPLPPLRRLQPVDEATRIPEPDMSLIYEMYPPWSLKDGVIILGVVMFVVVWLLALGWMLSG